MVLQWGFARTGILPVSLGLWALFAAGAWLGGAEAPTKLVAIGLSPFVISLAMVAGVFVARWTLPLWFYVSVTGVVVYWMLYHLYGPR